MLVVSKMDRATDACDAVSRIAFPTVVEVSAVTGAGLQRLREALVERLETVGDALPGAEHLAAAVTALGRARQATGQSEDTLATPEIVALELRQAFVALESFGRGPGAEDILGRILSRFCVGK